MPPEPATPNDPAEQDAAPADEIETIKTPVRSELVSDVMLAESETGMAPSFRAPTPPPPPAAKPSRRSEKPMALLPGAKIDDFEVVRMLGRGAFGHVYLARQLSLDRLVALKVSANRGSEGRTMARLEHRHIVSVFSEIVEPDFNQRLLCMQLVPGIGLEKLIGALHAHVPGGDPAQPQPVNDWTGKELLAIIDAAATAPAMLDPSALHDREALARMDSVEATAWYGARLAEALQFAHRHGVLHRDIKPANILVNSYGQPMLADFNISSQPVGSTSDAEDMFGGTFAYMAPEHLDAFNPTIKEVGPEVVTPRSDLYALALVLRQLLVGTMGFKMPKRKCSIDSTLREMALDRRQDRSECSPGLPGARQTLERTLGRCLAPKPEDRFESGAELAEQLDGCQRLRQAERQLPPPPTVVAPALRQPFLWLIILTVLPHLLGSVINFAYNGTQIVPLLTSIQREQSLFWNIATGYNLVVYPLAIVLFVLALRPVWKCWRAMENGESVADSDVESARRRALNLPSTIAALAAMGWFPGGILFPLLIYLDDRANFNFLIGPHLLVSFFMSGLIALAYSLCGAQFIVLRTIYPRMWKNVRSFNSTTRTELAPMNTRFWYMQLLAGSIPLLAALLTLGLSDDSTNESYKLLVAGMIVLGWAGSQIAATVVRDLSQVIVALTSTKT